MLPLPAGREASPGEGAAHYVRHRPERMLLYQLVEEYYPAFVSAMAAQGTALPGYVQRSLTAYVTTRRNLRALSIHPPCRPLGSDRIGFLSITFDSVTQECRPR
jgi:hypothetical protein